MIADTAEGEAVRIGAGTSRQVVVTQARPVKDEDTVVTVSNANGFPVTVEIPIGTAGQKIRADALEKIDGVATLTVTVPPHGEEKLTYR